MHGFIKASVAGNHEIAYSSIALSSSLTLEWPAWPACKLAAGGQRPD